VFFSCGTGDALQVADQFHEKLDNRAFDFICDSLLDEAALEATPREEWMAVFETVSSWGTITNRKKTNSFSIKTNNGISTVKYNYTMNIGELFFYEALVLRKRGGTHKILNFAINTNKDRTDEFTKGY
jgi:hypothetical protein